VTSARVALRLRHHGIIRVRPLEGGLHQWQDLEYPIERLDDKGERPAATRPAAPLPA
jgi:3-mercaptopyruvate sulfurtransferase SseA